MTDTNINTDADTENIIITKKNPLNLDDAELDQIFDLMYKSSGLHTSIDILHTSTDINLTDLLDTITTTNHHPHTNNKIVLPICKLPSRNKKKRIIRLPIILSTYNHDYKWPDFIVSKLSHLTISNMVTNSINMNDMNDIINFRCTNSIMTKLIESKDEFIDTYTNMFNFIKKFNNDGNLLSEYDQSIITKESINKLENVYVEMITNNNVDDTMLKVIIIKYYSKKNINVISAEINVNTTKIKNLMNNNKIKKCSNYKNINRLMTEEIPCLFLKHDIAILLTRLHQDEFSELKRKYFSNENVDSYTFLRKKIREILKKHLPKFIVDPVRV